MKMMNYLSIDTVLAAFGSNPKPGQQIELEGLIDVKDVRDLEYKYDIVMIGSIPMKGMEEERKYCTFEKTETTTLLGKTTLEQIIQEMPKIVYSPACFPGAATAQTHEILGKIGFYCVYSTEENITVVAKRN